MDGDDNDDNNENDPRGGRSGASPLREGLTVAALRRSSEQTPTRTLQLSEQEHQQTQRELTPQRLSLEAQRPRSRNRTPQRAESPMDPDEFRRTGLNHNRNRGETGSHTEGGMRRITIRPGAGGAVGAVAPLRIREEAAEPPELSAKQGPSHRKVRRWENEHFDRVAAAIAPHSQSAAAALLKGKEDAHLYREVVHPADHHRSQIMSRFLEDAKMETVRARFFEGELPTQQQRHQTTAPVKSQKQNLSGQERLYLIDRRLRRVVAKACHNSYPACRVVKTFEDFLIQSFSPSKQKSTTTALADLWWHGLLLEPPTVNKRRDGQIAAQFHFDAQNAAGGFHRLLLHALCQFHGLSAASRMIDIDIGPDTQSARALMVSGEPLLGGESSLRMLEEITKNEESKVEVEALGSKVEDSWTVV